MGLLTTIKREANYMRAVLAVLGKIKDVKPDSTNLVCDDLEASVEKYGSNLAFIEDDKTLTYDEFEDYANRVAQWAIAEGCKTGDTVAVFVRNRLEYVALWYGLSKVGIIPALLNFQLSGDALAHCLNISDAKLLILDHELSNQWKAAKKGVEIDVKAFAAFGELRGIPSFDAAIAEHAPHKPSRDLRAGIKAGDQFMKMFIYGPLRPDPKRGKQTV